MQFSDQASIIGIMSVEGYHAGAIRELLIRQAYDTVVYNSMLVTNLTAARAATCERHSSHRWLLSGPSRLQDPAETLPILFERLPEDCAQRPSTA